MPKTKIRKRYIGSSCLQKRTFESEQEAIATFKSDPRYRPGVDVPRTYRCVYCHKFHLTRG